MSYIFTHLPALQNQANISHSICTLRLAEARKIDGLPELFGDYLVEGPRTRVFEVHRREGPVYVLECDLVVNRRRKRRVWMIAKS